MEVESKSMNAPSPRTYGSEMEEDTKTIPHWTETKLIGTRVNRLRTILGVNGHYPPSHPLHHSTFLYCKHGVFT